MHLPFLTVSASKTSFLGLKIHADDFNCATLRFSFRVSVPSHEWSFFYLKIMTMKPRTFTGYANSFRRYIFNNHHSYYYQMLKSQVIAE